MEKGIPFLKEDEKKKFKKIFKPSIELVGISQRQVGMKIDATSASVGQWLNKEDKFPKSDKYIALAYFFLKEGNLTEELENEWYELLKDSFEHNYVVYSKTLKHYLAHNGSLDEETMRDIAIEDIIDLNDIRKDVQISNDAVVNSLNKKTKEYSSSVSNDVKQLLELNYEDFTFLPKIETAVSLDELNNQINLEKLKYSTSKLNSAQISAVLEIVENLAILNSEANELANELDSDEIPTSSDYIELFEYLTNADKLGTYMSNLSKLTSRLEFYPLSELPKMLENPDNFVEKKE